MMSTEQKTTIENPFLKAEGGEFKPTIENPFGGSRGHSDQVRTFAPKVTSKPNVMPPMTRPEVAEPVRPASVESQYAESQTRSMGNRGTTGTQQGTSGLPINPGYYLSKASERMLAEVPVEELSEVLAVALQIGEMFSRRTPTISDVEVAIRFKTFANVRSIALGELEFDFLLGKAQEPMSKQQRTKFWKMIADGIIKKMDDQTSQASNVGV